MRRISVQLLVTLGCLLLLAYFGYHGKYGKHGLVAAQRIHAKIATLQTDLATLEHEKAGLEHRISLMMPESLDPDMLDQTAREMLNYVHPNDLIMLRPAE